VGASRSLTVYIAEAHPEDEAESALEKFLG
jgi:hypothetical protein